MAAGYTGLPDEHREAYEAQMRAHERAYAGVREHALAGSTRHFDEALTAGEREHQRALRTKEGLQEADVLRIRKELNDGPARRASSRRRVARRRNPTLTGARVARAGAGAATGALAEVAGAPSSGGNTFLFFVGVMLGLSLIYLLVAGKGTTALTGIVGVITGGVRTFIAPVDPIQAAEHALGAGTISSASAAPAGAAAASGGSSSASSSGVPGTAGGFLPKGAKFSLRRKDQGRDIQTTPGAGLLAPGKGVVLRVASDPSGFGPDYPIVHFETGPYAGKDVYYGHTDATLHAGQKFDIGAIIAHTSRTGHNAPPGWAEIGFAPGGSPGAFGQPSPF